MALFGQVLLAPILLVLAGAGLWLVWSKRENRRVRAMGAIFVLAAVGLGAQMVRASLFWRDAWDGLDISAAVSDQDIIGEWRTSDLAVVFLPDHTFTLTGKVQAHGHWEASVNDAFGQKLASPGGLVVEHEQWQAVRKKGELRLVRNTPLDWDEWNGDLGFRRTPTQ